MNTRLHCILGQTATGKTALAVHTAQATGGELVNCDSRQIYRTLDIITGKTDNPKDIPMHMVDCVDVEMPYSSYAYALEASAVIEHILARGAHAIVVGGSGSYARMLLYAENNTLPHSHVNLAPRSTTEQSVLAMQEKLQTLAPYIWDTMTPSDRRNPRRLARAITKLSDSSYERPLIHPNSKNTLASTHRPEIIILLHKDTAVLTDRIERRVRQRIEHGALQECTELLAQHHKPTAPGLMTIGYQSVFQYLAGAITQEELVTQWSAKERQYAKRQKTYLLKYFPDAHIRYV